MIDTVNITYQTSKPEQIISVLENPEYRTKADQTFTKVQGRLRNINISVKEYNQTCADVFLSGSLAKFHRGNNAETLTRRGTEEAIQHLSDTLHHDMSAALVRGRLDIGRNLIMKYPPEQYFTLMHSAPYMNKAYIGDTLYFQNNTRKIALYDKAEEMKRCRESLPECFQKRYILRYEHRIVKKLPDHLKRSQIACKDLYSEGLYSELVQGWKEAYFSIKKQKEGVLLNMESVHTLVNDLAFLGILTVGIEQVKTQIIVAYKSGQINRQQKHRYIAKLNEIATAENRENTSDLISELDAKIIQAARYAR